MPKVTDTRKQRAATLLERIKRGPHMAMPHEKLDQDQITSHYKLWAESWIINDLIDLVPELRKTRQS